MHYRLLALLPALAAATNHDMMGTGGSINIADVAAQLGVAVEAPVAASAAPMVHTAAAPAPMVAAAPAPAMVHSVAAPEVLAAPAPPAMVHTTTAAPMVHTAAAVLAAAPAVHTVTVGGSSLVFTPSSVTAAVGDVVTFVFLAKNHTVTQSTFAKPCVKLAPDGKDSGFMPNPAGDAAAAPTFDFTVSALEPSWWYCRQKTPTSHCGAGMVFAINPTAEKSFETFLAEAKKQNGTATAAADVAATAPVTLSVDNGGVAAATMTTAAAAVVAAPPVATETVVAPGWNAQGNAQACNCACFCGVGAFPQGDGVGAYGGYSGSLPAPWG